MLSVIHGNNNSVKATNFRHNGVVLYFAVQNYTKKMTYANK